MSDAELEKTTFTNESKATENQCQRSSYALRRSEFIDKIAHDMRTPFFGTREILQLVLSGGCGELQSELKPLLVLLKQTNEELIDLTQRLLEIYKYDSGRDSLLLALTNLEPIVRQSVEEMQSLARANEVALSFQSKAARFDLPLDQSAMERLLTSLLVTSIKNTASGGTLKLELEGIDGMVMLTLSANGLGIAQKDLDSIFLLVRPTSASHSYAPLAGLDLHLCRQIAYAHGGTIFTAHHKNDQLSIIIKLPIEP